MAIFICKYLNETSSFAHHQVRWANESPRPTVKESLGLAYLMESTFWPSGSFHPFQYALSESHSLLQRIVGPLLQLNNESPPKSSSPSESEKETEIQSYLMSVSLDKIVNHCCNSSSPNNSFGNQMTISIKKKKFFY